MATVYAIVTAWGDTGHEIAFATLDKTKADAKWRKEVIGIIGGEFDDPMRATDEELFEALCYKRQHDDDEDQLWYLSCELDDYPVSGESFLLMGALRSATGRSDTEIVEEALRRAWGSFSDTETRKWALIIEGDHVDVYHNVPGSLTRKRVWEALLANGDIEPDILAYDLVPLVGAPGWVKGRYRRELACYKDWKDLNLDDSDLV